jgi:hypothetical protein
MYTLAFACLRILDEPFQHLHVAMIHACIHVFSSTKGTVTYSLTSLSRRSYPRGVHRASSCIDLLLLQAEFRRRRPCVVHILACRSAAGDRHTVGLVEASVVKAASHGAQVLARRFIVYICSGLLARGHEQRGRWMPLALAIALSGSNSPCQRQANHTMDMLPCFLVYICIVCDKCFIILPFV